ncbi:MAG: two-component system sensor histidine kinase NtrB [Gammaproteobacteria bacterium]
MFSIYFIITVLLTAIQMYSEYRSTEGQIKEDLKILEQSFAPAISSSLWTFETNLVAKAGDGLLNNPKVVGVKIEQKGDFVWSWIGGLYKDRTEEIQNKFIETESVKKNIQKFEESKTAKLIENKFDLNYINTVNGKLEKLGEATIYSSSIITLQKVMPLFRSILVLAIIKTVALWYLFLWAGFIYISKPLDGFIKSISKIDMHNLKELEHFSEKTHIKTELFLLLESFNHLIFKLRQTWDEKNESEKRLLESQKHLQNIIDYMPSIIVGLNTEGEVTLWNKIAENILLIKSKDALNKKISQLIVDMQEFNFKEKKSIEKKTLNIDGEKKIFNILVYPLHSGETNFILRLDDISEKIKLESMIMQSEKMTSLGTLAAGMAHEINNPLGAILQGIQNIERRLQADNAKNQEIAKTCNLDLNATHQYLELRGIHGFIKGIREVGERAANIVKNVLRFSRHSDSTMVASDMTNIVNEVLSIITTDYDLTKSMDFKKIKIIKDLPNNLPFIVCSSLEIEQVILNIVKNAAQAIFMSEQKIEDPKIKISLALSNDQKFLSIVIEDNGPGMSEKVQAHIFEPFFTTKPVGVGTGLGLSMSYFIINEKHKGQLLVESKLGQGTKFTLLLPVDQNPL